jgi:RNA polymerase sigma-70 factor (ECF subfamily)
MVPSTPTGGEPACDDRGQNRNADEKISIVFYRAANLIHRDGQGSGTQGEESPMLLKDEELVARAQKDDQGAIEEFVSRYQKKAYAIAYHMCSGDSEEAQDLTQEAFLRVFRNIKKFRGDSSFYTWFYRIVVNTCLDGRRRRRRWERILSLWRPGQREEETSKEILEKQPDMGEGNNPMTVLSAKQLTREIRKALMSLPERQRVVFQLKVFQGMSIREIAQVMGSAEGTVKSHLFRATHSLRTVLKDWAVP